jgi:hypothetical protein
VLEVNAGRGGDVAEADHRSFLGFRSHGGQRRGGQRRSGRYRGDRQDAAGLAAA